MSAGAVVTGGLCPPVVGCDPLHVVAGSVSHAAASAVFGAVAAGIAGVASSVIGRVMALASVGSASDVLHSQAFGGQYLFMLTVGLWLTLPVLLVATMGAVLRQDLRRLGHIWGVALPTAAFGSVLAVLITDRALNLVDSLSTAMISSATVRPAAVFGSVSASLVASGGAVASVVGVLLAAGALALWLELVVRAAAVSIAVLFVPLALAGLVWPATSHLARRLVEMLAGLILSKFVIVAVLCLGAASMASDQPDSEVTGAAVLLLAAFAPFVVLRLVPALEAAAIGHLEGVSRRPFRAAERMATSPGIQRVMAGLSSGSRPGPQATDVGASPIAPTPGFHLMGDRGDGGSSSGGRAAPPGPRPGGPPPGGRNGGAGAGGGGADARGAGAGAGPAPVRSPVPALSSSSTPVPEVSSPAGEPDPLFRIPLPVPAGPGGAPGPGRGDQASGPAS